MRRRKRVGLVLGAGGVTGGAWLAGTLSEFAAATGWEPATADLVVGTSAGALMGALVASGLSARRLLPLPNGRASDWPLRELVQRETYVEGIAQPFLAARSLGLLLRAVASPSSSWTRATRLLSAVAPRGRVSTEAIHRAIRDAVPAGWARHPACWIVATDYASGRRVVFGRDRRADLASAVAASCAIPGVFGPVAIDGREYVDGGVASPTNADLAALAEVDVVICLNPLARRPHVPSLHPAASFEALVRESACRQVDREIASLRAGGIEVLLVEPGADELEVTGLDPMDPRLCLEIANRAAQQARLRLRDHAMAGVLRRRAA